MKRKFMSFVLAGVLSASLYAQSTDAPKPEPPKPAVTAPTPATQPPLDQARTLKLTIKLLKKAAARQNEISKAQLKVQIAQTKMQIFQREVTAKLAASRAKDSQ